jgi:hypothetical protein
MNASTDTLAIDTAVIARHFRLDRPALVTDRHRAAILRQIGWAEHLSGVQGGHGQRVHRTIALSPRLTRQ